MASPSLKLGTRGSRLALIQTAKVRGALEAALPDLRGRIEIVEFTTGGDTVRDKPLEALNVANGGRGIFTDELDRAVATGAVDAAIHSVKDLPPVLAEDVVIAAMLHREDPREAFVSYTHSSLAEVPIGGVFGSASVRREALVRALRPDIAFTLLRGNVDERVEALRGGKLDGTILAVAGLKRLSLVHVIREILEPDVLMPDPGQGAIGIVAAAGNLPLRRLLARVAHAPTEIAVTAERALLEAAGCARPVGGLATIEDGQIFLRGIVANRDGTRVARDSITGPVSQAAALGRTLGLRLNDREPHEAAA